MSASPFVNRHRNQVIDSTSFSEVDTREGGSDEDEEHQISRMLFDMRTTTQSPYKGYYKDSRTIIKDGEYEEDNFKTTMTMSLDEIEYRALVRKRDFREKLATKVVSRLNIARGTRAFYAWKGYVFRYVVLRQQMVRCFRMRGISLCFHGWSGVARRENVLRRVMKRYWKKHRLLRFKWWKLIVRWQSLKAGLLQKTFKALKKYYIFKHLVYRKFTSLSFHLRQDRGARTIQRACTAYQHKKVYWGHKKIKQFIYMRYESSIYRTRVLRESLRMKDEEVVYRAIVERAKTFLQNKLEEDEGMDLLKTYLFEVENALRREASKPAGDKTAVFPSKWDEPQMARLFTTRAKAMYILNKRGELDVLRLSREKFRHNAPPPYYCKECMSVFLTASQSRLHYRLGCPHEEGIHRCTSWVLARDITELALERLLINFFKKPKRK
jgi:hypothetical protein